ncbi:MAG: (4Fe-4S)-binding protein [Bacteroidetes bacterium]|nr:(4Fe-4S)-binding protein [Bacteroidota bacterium]
MKDITKHYDAGDVTIVWKPAKCIHAAECVKALPKVYNPKVKPWITPENATAEDIRQQIKKCPSGALSYTENNKPEISESKTNSMPSMQVAPNGPLLFHGDVELKNADGSSEVKSKITAFCRCGGSANKPYCDGSHKQKGFEG